MPLILAALQSGTDPLVPLPPATFHRTLEDPLICPKCHTTYNIVVDYDQAVGRYFRDESRRHFALLRKAIFSEHSTGHRSTHIETNGVTVVRHQPVPKSSLADFPVDPKQRPN